MREGRPGGILAGHDYVDGDLPQGEFYVKSAVDEFFGDAASPSTDRGPSAVEMFPTWIVEVPAEGIVPAPGRGQTASGMEPARTEGAPQSSSV